MQANQMIESDTILIIEDDEDISIALEEALKFEGFQVLSAPNGKQAIELIQRLGSPGLIFLDMMMPVMNGWQFLEARLSDPSLLKIPVIVISAAGDKAKVENIAGFLKKPADLDSVLQKAHEFCKTREPS